MQVKVLDWPSSLPLLRETHKIWSAGLSFADYLAYNHKQRCSFWGKRNLRLMALSRNGEILSSLKLYRLSLQSRGKSFPFFGIGAMYTPERQRGKGHALALVERIMQMAIEEQAAGLLLYSDIGADFYEQAGFIACGGLSFSITLPKLPEEEKKLAALGLAGYQRSPLNKEHTDLVLRHYRRWLSRSSFGYVREEDYLTYKIEKESFLHEKSRLAWPGLQILHDINIDMETGTNFYAIIEMAGSTLRVLELGGEGAWQAVLAHCLRENIRKIKGWEGVLAELAPGFRLDSLLSRQLNRPVTDFSFTFQERSWGLPMLLPLESSVETWCDAIPCPIPELDHL